MDKTNSAGRQPGAKLSSHDTLYGKQSKVASTGSSRYDLDEIRTRGKNILVAMIAENVQLKRVGKEYKASCPFGHADKTPSFTVVPAKGFYHCHSCGAHGDAIDWLQKIRGLEFQAAVKELGDRLGVLVVQESNGNGNGKRKSAEWVTLQGISYPADMGRLVKAYTYTDEEGNPLHRTLRFDPKTFRQNFYNADEDKWVWKEDKWTTPRWVLYKLPAIKKTTAANGTVFLLEGEKDADNLVEAFKLCGTTPAKGANKPWLSSYTESLRGARTVVIIADNDEPGRKHADTRASELTSAGLRVKVVILPGGGKDFSDWLAAGGKLDQFLELVKSAKFWEQPEPVAPVAQDGERSEYDEIAWQEPADFEAVIEPPDLPCDLLPSWLGRYAREVSQQTQTKEGLAVMMALSTVATCIQKAVYVCPYGDAYQEPTNLWTATVLPPASRKTAVVNSFTAPLAQWEKLKREELAEPIARREAEQSVIQKRMECLEKSAAKLATDHERQAAITEISELRIQLSSQQLLVPRLWTSDITPERLQNLLVEHGERMSILADEGGIFAIMSGLYNNGQANIDVLLQAHASSPVRVDRAGRTALLQSPALTMGLTLQPGVLEDLGSTRGKRLLRQNGALARFLWCIPPNNIGQRNLRQRRSVSTETGLRYEASIGHLLRHRETRKDPLILSLSEQAKECWLRFSEHIESRQGRNGDLAEIQDWSGKLPGQCLRIAGILQVVESDFERDQISAEVMERAVQLCTLLIPHAQFAFGSLQVDPVVADAKYILAYLKQNQLHRIKQRDLHRLGRFTRSTSERLFKALELLHHRNIISRRQIETSSTKPSYFYQINPLIHQ